MKSNLSASVLFLFLTSTICFAEKRRTTGDTNDASSKPVVTSVTLGKASGTGVIAISDSSTFTVTNSTIIMLDGSPVALAAVHSGLQVLSHTAEGDSAPEIDLKSPTISTTPAKGN